MTEPFVHKILIPSSTPNEPEYDKESNELLTISDLTSGSKSSSQDGISTANLQNGCQPVIKSKRFTSSQIDYDKQRNRLSRNLCNLLNTEQLYVKQTAHKYMKTQKRLSALSQLVVSPVPGQQNEPLTNANRYEIYDQNKQLIFLAENIRSNYLATGFEEKRPPFKAVLINEFKKPVIWAKKFGSSLWSDKICIKWVDISDPEASVIGFIKKPLAFLKLNFLVTDPQGNLVFKVVSPVASSFGAFDEAKYKVYGQDGKTKIGEICKQWSGMSRELCTDIDAFSVSWPPDLDIVWKGVLLLVTLLIDYTFYENTFI